MTEEKERPIGQQILQKIADNLIPIFVGLVGLILILMAIFLLDDKDPDKVLLVRYGDGLLLAAGSSQLPSRK